MSSNIPTDLVKLQRDFLDADALCEKIAASHPRPTEIAAERAQVTAEQQAELAKARAGRLAAMDKLHAHPWWAGQENRAQARLALIAAAKS